MSLLFLIFLNGQPANLSNEKEQEGNFCQCIFSHPFDIHHNSSILLKGINLRSAYAPCQSVCTTTTTIHHPILYLLPVHRSILDAEKKSLSNKRQYVLNVSNVAKSTTYFYALGDPFSHWMSIVHPLASIIFATGQRASVCSPSKWSWSVDMLALPWKNTFAVPDTY